MIPTGEYDGTNTIYNKIVFTDGNFETPSILKVLEVNKEFEQQNRFIEWLFKEYENGLSKSREIFRVIELYSKQQGEMFCREFSIEDFGTLSEIKQQRTTFRANNQDNQRKQDGTRSGRKVEFSLKDSDGNLLVVYHGSPSKFTEFSHGFMNTNGNAHGKGFYFTEDVEYADGVAICNENKIFIVDSGKEDGKINFGFRKKITISDTERRERYIANINKESYEKNHGDRTVFERLGVDVDNDSRSVIGRELGKESATNSKKSKNNENGISATNGTGRVQLLKDICFSLKDNATYTLSDGQVKKKVANFIL